jgi:hypothetical protein
MVGSACTPCPVNTWQTLTSPFPLLVSVPDHSRSQKERSPVLGVCCHQHSSDLGAGAVKGHAQHAKGAPEGHGRLAQQPGSVGFGAGSSVVGDVQPGRGTAVGVKPETAAVLPCCCCCCCSCWCGALTCVGCVRRCHLPATCTVGVYEECQPAGHCSIVGQAPHGTVRTVEKECSASLANPSKAHQHPGSW